MQLKIKNFRPKFSRRHLFIGVVLVVLIYAATSTVNVIGRNYRLQQEVDALNQEVDLLSLQNQELEYRIAYLKTDAFAEKEARDKLSLQAPGEHVVIFSNKIPNRLSLDKKLAEAARPKSFIDKSTSNFEEWLYFLFRTKPN